MGRIVKVEVGRFGYDFVGEFKFFKADADGKVRRPSILLRLTDEQGIQGWGQAVPIPTWTYETVETVETTLSGYLAEAILGADPAEDVAVADDDGPGVDPRVAGRKTGRLERLQQHERRLHGARRGGEPQQYAVPEQLHHPATVCFGMGLRQPGELQRHRGDTLVSALFRETGEPGQVDERHGRRIVNEKRNYNDRTARYRSNGDPWSVIPSRWLRTTWNASPARMYSRMRRTPASKSSRLVALSKAGSSSGSGAMESAVANAIHACRTHLLSPAEFQRIGLRAIPSLWTLRKVSGRLIVDVIQTEAFDSLDAPVGRVTQADVPMPYAKNLEKLAKPSADRVVAACNSVMYSV